MKKSTEQDFEILPHKKGASIKARGRTLEALFSHALNGLAVYLYPEIEERKKTEPNVGQKITVEAVDINSLLAEFITTVIGYAALQNRVFTEAVFSHLGENFLEGELAGIETPGASEKEIREVSYEEIEVKKNAKTGLYETLLVLEV